MSRPQPRLRLATGLRLGVAAALCLTGFASLQANAGFTTPCNVSPDKCFSFTILGTSPETPHTGESVVYTGKLKNLSKPNGNILLGSANITANNYQSVSAGTVNGAGSESVDPGSNVVKLRDLALEAGSSVTFTFTAMTIYQGSHSFTAEGKQSNDFNGVGNNLSWYEGSSGVNVLVASGCYGDQNNDVGGYDACGETVINPPSGGANSSGDTNSHGGDSRVTATLTYPPANGAPFISRIRTDVPGTPSCVSAGPVDVPCRYVVTVDTKFPSEYDLAHAITMTIDCDVSLCPASPLPPVMVAFNSGQEMVLLPCPPVPVANPVTGSYACVDPSSTTNHIIIRNITAVDDWKVANLPFDVAS